MKFEEYEGLYIKNGINLICGIDEAGRGPLAGPVAAAAILPILNPIITEVNDSKQLSDKKRRQLYPLIKEIAISTKTVFIDNDIIDEINILEATKLAMKECLAAIFPLPEMVLVDAVKLNVDMPTRSIIHGDSLSYTIAAASILAKVERDNLMLKYAEEFPEYGFEENKGYGTKHHIEMLRKYGPCKIHRKSFIKNILE